MKYVVIKYIKNTQSNEEGEKIFNLIHPLLKSNKKVTLSFKGINACTTSFINSALVFLLVDIDLDTIKRNLNIIDSNKYINDLIKRGMYFENERLYKKDGLRYKKEKK